MDSRRYRRAFEPGCSIGILDRSFSLDLRAYRRDRHLSDCCNTGAPHCAHLDNVNIHCGSLPKDVPAGTFDLVVLSEIGYYFDRQQLSRIGSDLAGRLELSGVLLAVHWLGHSEDHLLHGDSVHEILSRLDGLTLEYSERHVGFRIDRWVRR